MATSIKYRSVNGKNGNTTANNIPVIAKCFALSSVIDENFEVNFEKKANSVFLAEFKLIKNYWGQVKLHTHFYKPDQQKKNYW